jgi:hypothetical protein
MPLLKFIKMTIMIVVKMDSINRRKIVKERDKFLKYILLNVKKMPIKKNKIINNKICCNILLGKIFFFFMFFK